MATPKQKKALEIIMESHGTIPVSRAMEQAGYTPATAKNPKNLTTSLSFQEYMKKAGVDEEKLVKVMREGLEANKTIVMGKDEDSFVDIQPDHPTRHKFLETALKVSGVAKDKDTGNTNVFIGNQFNAKEFVD